MTTQLESLAQKTDTIVHVNGNVLKGDLKKMEYGIITWKMDGMGTINVEEPFVSSIISKKQFEIVLKNGLIYFSSFEASDSTGEVIITNGSEKVSIKIEINSVVTSCLCQMATSCSRTRPRIFQLHMDDPGNSIPAPPWYRLPVQ